MNAFPSLRGLQAFEAAARTGSFAAAARELSVSPAAVSQLIRALEGQVDRRLFHRARRGITLTEAGLEVYPRLNAAFEELRGVAGHLSGVSRRPRLTVSVPQSVASGWLSVRIAEFVEAHGPFDIAQRGEEDPVDFDHELIDVRMSYGRFHYRAHDTQVIATDAAFPVCSPAFVERYGPFNAPQQLLHVPLIHTDWGPAAANFPSWRRWFEGQSVSPGHRAERGLVANSSSAAIELASSGLGVALSQGMLAQRPLEHGRLLRPVDGAMVLDHPYCLTIPERSAGRPIVAAFRSWFAQECKRSTL